MGEVLCSTENSPFLIIDHIHAKINRVCCAALAIGKRCMNVRKNKLFYNVRLLFYRLPYVNCPALKVRYGKLEKIEKGHAIISSNKHCYCVLGKRDIIELEIKEKSSCNRLRCFISELLGSYQRFNQSVKTGTRIPVDRFTVGLEEALF